MNLVHLFQWRIRASADVIADFSILSSVTASRYTLNNALRWIRFSFGTQRVIESKAKACRVCRELFTFKLPLQFEI